MLNDSQEREFNRINEELLIIAKEVNNLADAVRNDFRGIGNNNCADCLIRVGSRLYGINNMLSSCDKEKLTPEFEKKMKEEQEKQ